MALVGGSLPSRTPSRSPRRCVTRARRCSSGAWLSPRAPAQCPCGSKRGCGHLSLFWASPMGRGGSRGQRSRSPKRRRKLPPAHAPLGVCFPAGAAARQRPCLQDCHHCTSDRAQRENVQDLPFRECAQPAPAADRNNAPPRAWCLSRGAAATRRLLRAAVSIGAGWWTSRRTAG